MSKDDTTVKVDRDVRDRVRARLELLRQANPGWKAPTLRDLATRSFEQYLRETSKQAAEIEDAANE
jgi:Mg2+ and Co2+ transporter CorA